MTAHTEKEEALLHALGTDRKNGLSGEKAAKRLAEHGPNTLKEKKNAASFCVFWISSRM